MADTVLIVDDDEAVLTMLYKVIRSNGIEADTVASGEEALERTAQRTYDLILLDVNLMGMDGFQVVQTLRQRGVRTPIIIVWFGNNQSSIIIVALLTSIVVTILSVLNGFLQVDEDQIKLIRIFGGTKRQVLTMVVFPANIPCILNALKINVGLSFVGVIVGEFLVAQDGLGFLIVYSSQTFAMRVVLLSVVILAILSALMYRAISLLEKQFHKWQG